MARVLTGIAATPWRFAALLVALLIYGLWGSPTPPGFGWPEILVACGLVLAVSPGRVLAVMCGSLPLSWLCAAQILLVYGLTIPLLLAFIHGHNPWLILRDIIPFFFLLLPLFLTGPPMPPERIRLLTGAVALVGLSFSIRAIEPALGPFLAGHSGLLGAGGDPLYLSIAPTVSFAAVLAGGLAGTALVCGVTIRNFLSALFLAALAVLPLAAMAMTLQRAGLGLWVLAMGLLLLLALRTYPARAAGALVFAFLAALFFWPAMADIATSLWHKNLLVGQNNRLQETIAVFDHIGGTFFGALFGRGWGAVLADPAVSGATVNFTHNIFTSFLLKTGLCGTGLALFYLTGLVFPLLAGLRRAPVIVVALAVPLAIDTTLYASFKSLDFGLILLLTALWGQKLRTAPA